MLQTDTVRVDPSNADQALAWDGDEGSYWAAHADRYDDALARYRQPFLTAAGYDVADRVLDIGCGTGQTTRDAGRRAASALGVDLSSEMIAHARLAAAREGVTNVSFRHADAQIHPFVERYFDVAVSRTGAMFFGDPVAAFTNIRRALRPGGRLVLLAWRPPSENEWIKEFLGAMSAGRDLALPPPDAQGGFSLSDPDRVRTRLAAAGFVDNRFDGLREPMYFGRDSDGAFRFILGQIGWMLRGLDDGARAHALDALRGSVEAHQTAEGVLYGSAAWIITAQRP